MEDLWPYPPSPSWTLQQYTLKLYVFPIYMCVCVCVQAHACAPTYTFACEKLTWWSGFWKTKLLGFFTYKVPLVGFRSPAKICRISITTQLVQPMIIYSFTFTQVKYQMPNSSTPCLLIPAFAFAFAMWFLCFLLLFWFCLQEIISSKRTFHSNKHINILNNSPT